MQQVTLLGATGSIGQSTLDVISRHPERFEVFALTAGSNWQELARLCSEFRPRFAVIADTSCFTSLVSALKERDLPTQAMAGVEALGEVASAPEVTTVVAAIVGAAGLLPTLEAAKSGKRILLANKEALVMSGDLLVSEVRKSGAQLLPIDSEHNAIFQCLPPQIQQGPVDGDLHSRWGVRRVLLTASGGPFLNRDQSSLEHVTPVEACRHPKWDMGRKISVDSATLMNKGLELIEACYLFGLSVDQIEVHVHPQAIIHSMVEYNDGSILAQLGSPDMRTPIAHALAWPDRIESGVRSLNLFDMASLEFQAPDLDRFPCLRLASEAYRQGGLASTVLNAANEVAVSAFLNGAIRFTRIPGLVERALDWHPGGQVDDLDAVLSADLATREKVHSWLQAERT